MFMTQVGYFDNMSNAAALGCSIGRTTTSYLPRTAAAAMRIQDGRTPLCDCPVASADADAKSLEYKQQTTDVSCAAASGAGRRRPIFFHSPMVHSEEGSDIPLQHVDETDPRASGDWRSPRTLPTKPARFVPRGDGVPRHRAAASGAGCDLRSQGLARGYGDQQRLCRQLLGWPWVMGLRAGYFHTDVGK